MYAWTALNDILILHNSETSDLGLFDCDSVVSHVVTIVSEKSAAFFIRTACILNVFDLLCCIALKFNVFCSVLCWL